MKHHLGKLAAPIDALSLLVGCAQTGPPLPPSLELPKPPADLRATPQRRSCHAKLERAHAHHRSPKRALSRSNSSLPQPRIRNRECGNPVATVPAPTRACPQKPSSARPAPQTYTDTSAHNHAAQDPAAEVTYAVEVLNRNARGAAVSNRVHVPAVATAASAERSRCQTDRRRRSPHVDQHRRTPESLRRSTPLSHLSPRRKLRQRHDCRRTPAGRSWPRIFHRLRVSPGKRPTSIASPPSASSSVPTARSK